MLNKLNKNNLNECKNELKHYELLFFSDSRKHLIL